MKKVNIITKRAKRNLAQELRTNDFVQIEGRLEMAAMKNGKVFHYDVGSNVVTIWAKHATMHLLTGEAFSSHGNQREFDTGSNDHSLTYNPDGTLLSGNQYFALNGANYGLENRWTKSTLTPNDDPSVGDSTTVVDEVKYPFFPSKMLFGTGFEWETWADVVAYGDGYSTKYEEDSWSTHFDSNVLDADNDYSNTFIGTSLEQTRTMNDIYSGSLTNSPLDTDFAVQGAVKNGLYFDNATQGVGEVGARIEMIDDNEFSIQEYRGVGKPSFIYALRNQRFMFEGSEVRLSSDDGVDIENKITFTVNMPEQTGGEAGLFYPYNGFILKQAGLFCDARMLLENTVPINPGTPEIDNYNKMPYGIMIAKRNIAPIQKSHDVAISSRWTLYL